MTKTVRAWRKIGGFPRYELGNPNAPGESYDGSVDFLYLKDGGEIWYRYKRRDIHEDQKADEDSWNEYQCLVRVLDGDWEEIEVPL